MLYPILAAGRPGARRPAPRLPPHGARLSPRGRSSRGDPHRGGRRHAPADRPERGESGSWSTPVERLPPALLVAAGRPGTALRWRRRDAVGVLAGSIDALGGTVRGLQARIDGLDRQDPLTGALNHRGLHDALHEMLERRDQGTKVALVEVDIDDFESLNDSRGHAAGDEVLRIAARVIAGEPAPATFGRIGGDEFLLALPDSTPGAPSASSSACATRSAAPLPEGARGLDFSAASPSSPATPATSTA